jgi:uncharacterized protein (UPF0332 family)
MNGTNFPSDEEIKKFYTLFCEIFTAFHNYATAKKLSKSKIYTWSLTAYYYSLMHCGRAICYMALKCFPKRHEALHKFLKGENLERREKFWKLDEPKGISEQHTFEELLENLPVNNNSVKSKIKKLGEYLEKIKKVREFNSYEMFIVAHQIEHYVLSPKLKKGSIKICQIVKNYLIFVMDLFFAYVQPKADYFKAFLLDRNQNNKWAFEYLLRTLSKQRFGKSIIEEVKTVINDQLLSRISVQMECPDSFYEPISFQVFSGKSQIINDFIKLIDDVDNETN